MIRPADCFFDQCKFALSINVYKGPGGACASEGKELFSIDPARKKEIICMLIDPFILPINE
jgi:hypothetical protein